VKFTKKRRLVLVNLVENPSRSLKNKHFSELARSLH